ncbi:MAG: dipeptide epimerase [Planctomycetota bacterium]
MSRIQSIEAASVDLDLKESFSISGGASAVAEIVVIRVTLSDGTVGLGEAAPFVAYDGQSRKAVLEALKSAAPAVVGLSPLLSQQIDAQIRESAPGSSCAQVAIEMAALDALCKSQGFPLWRYLGSKDVSLKTDLTVVAGDLDHAARSAEVAFQNGFRTLKIKVGRDGVEQDLARLRAVSSSAPDCGLILDANGGYTGAEAESLMLQASALEIPVELFEQPVSAADESAMAHLVSLELWPICADESCRSSADAMRISQNRLADAINIKIQKSGYLETLRIIEIARAAGLSLMIGGMIESVLSMSFSAHLARGKGVFRWIDLDTPLFIVDHPFVGGISFDNGNVVFQDEATGHSVSLNNSVLNWQELAMG